MNEDVYMLEQLKSFSRSSNASAVGAGIVLTPVSVGVRAMGVIAGSADQTAAETTLDLSNTL